MLDERSEPLLWTTVPAPRPRRWIRRAIPAIAAVGLLAGAAGAGTVATFTAATDNGPGNAFATGTLVLSNQIPSATTCLSTDGGMPANAADCDQLFDVVVQRPGDTAAADLDLDNVGSIDGDLGVHVDDGCTNGQAGDTTHHGTGDLCGALLVSIQQYADAAARTAEDTTGGTCLYGGNAGGQTCDFGDPAADVAALATDHTDFTEALDLGAMPTTGLGSTRYLRISVHLDAGAGNAYQGRTATFGLTWRLEQ